MALYEALIFDLDGTLWDSSHAVTESWNRVFSKLGVEKQVSLSEVTSVMGLPHDEVMRRLGGQGVSVDSEKLVQAALLSEIESIRQKGGLLYPGVSVGLEMLRTEYRLAVVSNCQTDYLKLFFEMTGLKALFEDSECFGNTGKPKAENIRLLKARQNYISAAYIGDTAGDQFAAQRAGLDYYHVTYGFGEPDRDCLKFGSFMELVKFFTKSYSLPS